VATLVLLSRRLELVIIADVVRTIRSALLTVNELCGKPKMQSIPGK
jgi:hypothetical protein